jgi:integrase/recombinase XerD
MGFSCKIILAERQKADKSRQVYLQAIIDRQRATVALGFCLKEEQFDGKRQVVKSSHPNHKDYNTELINAIAKANSIASKFRREDRMLTPEEFRKDFIEPSSKLDVIKFIDAQLELKREEMAPNTYKTHAVLVNKLREFRKEHRKKLGSFLAFQQLTPDLLQLFKNWMGKQGNMPSTMNKQLKYFKQYLAVAQKREIKFKDPFSVTKIRTIKSTKVALTQKEVDKLEKYFDSDDCLPSHRKLLRYFLFSCYTGLRISDIKRITWNNINDDVLIFTPKKGEDNHPKQVSVPLVSKDKKFLPPATPGGTIFETFAEATTNRMLKKIAALPDIDIRKKITYHTSRHTFGSLFAQGGNVVALKEMMGHGNISTSMGYVHMNVEDLIKAKKDRFGE